MKGKSVYKLITFFFHLSSIFVNYAIMTDEIFSNLSNLYMVF